jgi:ATP synthase protein I
MTDRTVRAAPGAAVSDRSLSAAPSKSWADEEAEARDAGFKALSRTEAQALRAKSPSLSPWWVVAAQAAVGVAVSALAGAATGSAAVAMSALFGATVVVLPGSLMARGMTSRLSALSPGVGAVSFMSWEFAKIACAVGMLLLAPKIVQPLSWPALLVAMLVCIQMYWLAPMWRRRR